MTLAEKLDKMLPIVADSWSELRKCDVYRLLVHWDTEELPRVGALIVMNRNEFVTEVGECIADILADRE